MARFRVGVKYCGHCNPLVDGPDLVREVLAGQADLELVSRGDPEMQLLLIVSACAVDCVGKPVFSGPVIQVAGTRVDGKTWPPQELPRALRSAIRALLTSAPAGN